MSRNKTWHFRAIKLGKTAINFLAKQHVVVYQFRASCSGLLGSLGTGRIIPKGGVGKHRTTEHN